MISFEQPPSIEKTGIYQGFIASTFYFLLPFFSTAGPVDFEEDLKPVLERKCLGCHNPNIAKGGLSFSSAAEAFDSEKRLIIPGKPFESELYLAATSEVPGERPSMPDEGDPLTEAEAGLLERWIADGAGWPKGLVLREASKADRSWWAYQKLKTPKKGSIDMFVVDRLKARGLKLNPPADRRTLIRRATYDLHGLPPTPEEVDKFVESQDPNAYRSLVDRLLASPRYGERWGRHWLDVVRFGESNGFERNFIINELWPFRDYVIQSINEDKPFDQFIREHVAGDVFDQDRSKVAIGSAFLVAGPYDDVGNQDPKAKAQIRANTLDEIIQATSEAFLGMTVGCARCHDHKFDPISQKDYYRMYASLSGVRHGRATIANREEKQARAEKIRPLQSAHDALTSERKVLDQAIRKRCKDKLAEYAKAWTRPKSDRAGTVETFPVVEAKFVRLLCDANDLNPGSKSFRIDEFEVYSAGANPQNVALASAGGRASGAARKIEDFPGAYGPQLTIDGKFGARFISASNELVVELAEPTLIDRVVFSSGRVESVVRHSKFSFVADYRVEVSLDRKNWQEVANGDTRKPVSSAHQEHRLAKLETTKEELVKRASLTREINGLAAEIRKVPALPVVWIGTRSADDAKGPFHLFIGGSPLRKGEEVLPASLSTLNEVTSAYELPEDSLESERRLELAAWIVHPSNPLTPRVLANRVWHYHFGTGLVDTPNDFGYMGGRPTHPDLLDFLAAKLKGNGWKLKEIHRLIMLSKTYRQSSDHRAEAALVDGDSRLLWRFPPRRLSAEEIRDTMLTVSGKLDLKMGGPGFQLYKHMSDNVSTYEPLDEHGPKTYRRAVYHQNVRASVVDLMAEFDQPDCALSAPRRAQTTTPLQALTMLNHQFTIDMADAFAARVGEKAVGEQVRQVYQLAYSREPSLVEAGRTAEVIQSSGLRAACRAVLNSSELIYLD